MRIAGLFRKSERLTARLTYESSDRISRSLHTEQLPRNKSSSQNVGRSDRLVTGRGEAPRPLSPMSERQPIMDLPTASTSYTSREPRDPDIFDACTCHDPPGCSLHNSAEYLSRINLHQRLPSCSRTGLPVTYMDAGDPQGVPLLFMLPSGCTRWVGIQLGELFCFLAPKVEY